MSNPVPHTHDTDAPSSVLEPDTTPTMAVHVEPTSPTEVPKMLGPYQLGRELGRGAMGAVYEATHTKLKRRVAIKLLPAVHGHLPQRVDRFTAEMEAIGRLDHPHVVRAFDAGEVDGLHYLVMEFVEGIDVEKLIMLGAIPHAAAADIIRQTAIGLQHIHEHHLVHRDIKPSNLILSNLGIVKILDLGIAKLRDESTQLTAIGGLIGTPDYLAPEQAQRSTSIDIRADIYSLGCTFYTLLAGLPAFSGPEFDQPVDKLLAHCCEYPEPLIGLVPGLPEAVAKVVDKMMEKRPEDRYQTPQEVVDALAPFVHTQGKDTQDLVQLALVGRALEGMPQVRRRTTTESLVSKTLKARNRQASQSSLGIWIGSAAVLVAVFALLMSAQGHQQGTRTDLSVGPPQSLTRAPQDASTAQQALLTDSSRSQSTLIDHAAAIRDHAAQTATSSQQLERTTDQIAATLETLLQSSTASRESRESTGLIPSPSSAGEAYHNARIYQQQGNNGKAKESFLLSLQFEPKYIDVFQDYATFLTLHEGVSAARKSLVVLAEGADQPIRDYVHTLTKDEAARREGLESLLHRFPQFAPACFDLAQTFSDERIPNPTLADIEQERRWLERFRELAEEGEVLKYLLDHSRAAEWLRSTKQRLARLNGVAEEVLENPVEVHLQRAGQQWMMTIRIAEEATEIFYRVDGQTWESTGFSNHTHPRSGRPIPLRSVPLANLGHQVAIDIRYVDLEGNERGPFSFPLDPAAEETAFALRAVKRMRPQWARFGEDSHKNRLFLSTLRTYRSVISSIHYGIDVAEPTEAHDPDQATLDLPDHAEKVVLKVTFVDGTESPLVTFQRNRPNRSQQSPTGGDQRTPVEGPK